MRLLSIPHEEVPVHFTKLERDPIPRGQVIEMEQTIYGAEVDTVGQVDDVFVVDEFNIFAFFHILFQSILFLIAVQTGLFRGRGAPLDELRGEHLQTCVTELELECLV